jgi:acetyl-CoA carboxylase carboxyltransferase component
MGMGFAGPTNFASVCDYVPVVDGRSTMGIAGPPIVKAGLGLDVSKDDYDAAFHTTETGIAHRSFPSDEACLDSVARYLSYFPRNATRDPPRTESVPPRERDIEDLIDVVPADPKKPYDAREVVGGVVDRDSLFEYQPEFAPNVLVGFARIEGRSVGVVANNPRYKAGAIDVDATNKAPRFVSLCDAYDVPVVVFVDVPGFLPGPEQERQGLGRTAGKFVSELARATTPVVNVTVRRGYGFAYIAMGGGRESNRRNLVWPTGEMAGMSIEGAVSIAYGDEIEQAEDPEEKREELIAKYKSRTGPLRAAEGMGVDAVIDPRDTREVVACALSRAEASSARDRPPKKHAVPPF